MIESIEALANAYPKVTALCVWSLLVIGAIWEYRINRRRHLLGAVLLFLFGVLAFWISMLDELGTSRWILMILIAGAGVAIAVYLRKQPDRDLEAKRNTGAGPSA